jgi:hypothetical protein
MLIPTPKNIFEVSEDITVNLPYIGISGLHQSFGNPVGGQHYDPARPSTQFITIKAGTLFSVTKIHCKLVNQFAFIKFLNTDFTVTYDFFTKSQLVIKKCILHIADVNQIKYRQVQ